MVSESCETRKGTSTFGRVLLHTPPIGGCQCHRSIAHSRWFGNACGCFAGRESGIGPACLAKDIDALLAFFRQPSAHCRKIRTTNAIERQFREVRRRTDAMTCFAHHNSAHRILFASFTHANQRWATSLLKEFTQNS